MTRARRALAALALPMLLVATAGCDNGPARPEAAGSSRAAAPPSAATAAPGPGATTRPEATGARPRPRRRPRPPTRATPSTRRAAHGGARYGDMPDLRPGLPGQRHDQRDPAPDGRGGRRAAGDRPGLDREHGPEPRGGRPGDVPQLHAGRQRRTPRRSGTGSPAASWRSDRAAAQACRRRAGLPAPRQRQGRAPGARRRLRAAGRRAIDAVVNESWVTTLR